MTRPRGEVRQALADAVCRLAAERGPVSAREAAAAAQVGYEVAARTLENMVRSAAPEVLVAGQGKLAGQRWHALYEPVTAQALDADVPQPWGGIEALGSVMRTWPLAATEPATG